MTTHRTLGLLRVVVGGIFLVRSTPLIHLVPGLFVHHGGPLLGWPRDGRVEAAVFGLVLPALVVKALVVVRTVAALAFTIGLHARVAGIVTVVAAYLVYAQEPFALIFTLHVLYQTTLLLACGDAVGALSVRPSPPRSLASSLWLLRGFSASIYLWSGVAKLRGEWLSGRTLTLLVQHGYADSAVARALLGTPQRAAASAWLVALVELALPGLLFAGRTRHLAIAAACAMHAVFEVTMHPDVFGWVMVALLGAWFADDPDGLAHLPTGNVQRAPSAKAKHPEPPSSRQSLITRTNSQRPSTHTPLR